MSELTDLIEFRNYMLPIEQDFLKYYALEKQFKVENEKLKEFVKEKPFKAKLVQYVSLSLIMYAFFGIILSILINMGAEGSFGYIYSLLFINKSEIISLIVGVLYLFSFCIYFFIKKRILRQKVVILREAKKNARAAVYDYYKRYKEKPPVLFELSLPSILTELIGYMRCKCNTTEECIKEFARNHKSNKI